MNSTHSESSHQDNIKATKLKLSTNEVQTLDSAAVPQWQMATNGNGWQKWFRMVKITWRFSAIQSCYPQDKFFVGSRIVCFVWSTVAEMNLETSEYGGWPTLFWSCNVSCVLTVEKKRQVFTGKMFGNESLISFRGESEQFLESRGRSDT